MLTLSSHLLRWLPKLRVNPKQAMDLDLPKAEHSFRFCSHGRYNTLNINPISKGYNEKKLAKAQFTSLCRCQSTKQCPRYPLQIRKSEEHAPCRNKRRVPYAFHSFSKGSCIIIMKKYQFVSSQQAHNRSRRGG